MELTLEIKSKQSSILKVYRFESGYYDTMNIEDKFWYNCEPMFPHILRTNKIHYMNSNHDCISVEHPSPAYDMDYFLNNNNVTYVVIFEEKNNYNDKFYKIDKEIDINLLDNQMINQLCINEIEDNSSLHNTKYAIVLRY
jgi:hypothetical protein